MERDKAEVKYFLIRLGVMMVVFWLLFGVVFGVTAMKDNSMSPKLEAGDLVLYYRLGKKLNDRSVIVFCKEDRQYVGRIVAVAGTPWRWPERMDFTSMAIRFWKLTFITGRRYMMERWTIR